MIKKRKERTFKDIINVFVPKIWVLLVVGAIFASLMGGYSLFIKKDTYTTTIDVMVSPKEGSGIASNGNFQSNQFAQQIAKSYEKVVFGGDFLDNVSKCFSEDEDLVKCLTRDNPNNSTVTVDSEIVKKIFDEIEEAYNGSITPAKLKRMITVKTDAETPSFSLKVTSNSPIVTWAVARVLVYQIEDEGQLDLVVRSGLESAVFTQPDEENYSKISANSKNTVRNSLIAFAIGVILAAAAVWVYSMFDIVIRDVAKIEENIDIPILGVIPRHEIGAEEVKRK